MCLLLRSKILIPFVVLVLVLFTACGGAAGDGAEPISGEKELPLSYATQFSVRYSEDGFAHIHIADGTDYIIIPRGEAADVPESNGTVVIEAPVENIYLAASSAMDLFAGLDALDQIKACSTAAEDYSIEEARKRIADGRILYVGKYSAPDYELLVKTGCGLAIESTMISHAPKIKEELERLGIPVLVERSSYEKHPLGRLEWIKLYGVLTGREKEAAEFFAAEEKKVLEVERRLQNENAHEEEKKTVAFFYISSNGYVNIRKPGDYVSAMIEMAGGRYACDGLADESDNALSTMNINWEEFYRDTVDADILIYNATIDGGVASVDELIEKNALFADFKAVKEGQLYCSNADMFQKTSLVADIITDFYKVVHEEDTEHLQFMDKVGK